MKIALGSDHGGYGIKEAVRAELEARGLETMDAGCHGPDSVDYPDYAREVARSVSRGSVDRGVLVCTTGIGMSITANRFPGVRAALCSTPDMALRSRTHNDANVLVLAGGSLSGEEAKDILAAWLENDPSGEERHLRRIRKMESYAAEEVEMFGWEQTDPDTHAAIQREIDRQQTTLNLIASENYVSPAVRRAQGSVMTNKYAEGYPGKRWYNGCGCVDEVELLAIERAKELFGAEHANVQPHCGSSANMAVYLAVLEPGDTILAMSLAHGGHLTHGHKLNFSGRLFNMVSYGVDRETERIDYDDVLRIAMEQRPKMIVAGASAYPRTLDFDKFREIAGAVGACLMVDMAHIAGLVASGQHPDPVPHAEFVTTTTHKTLRGPRGGMILCRKQFAQELDRQVFPGVQGGPQMHTIAAKAVNLKEAMAPGFKEYARQIVANAAAMADSLRNGGLRLVSGGTDNHLALIDLSSSGMTGRDAAATLERAGIVVNKNTIPFDTRTPFLTSGIRVGTPAVTTRGMREEQMKAIADMIVRVLQHPEDEDALSGVRNEARELASLYLAP